MIKTAIAGHITDVFPIEHIGNFKKRVFWILEAGTEKPQNHYQVETWNADIDAILKFKVGELVTVHVEIRGKKWDKNGRQGVITTLRCTGIFRPEGSTPASSSIDDIAGDLPF